MLHQPEKQPMIRVENLVKQFGAKRAVNGISFSVERGEVLGLLGPNGAGKSTTMRIITGFYPATSGRVTVGGHDVATDPIRAKALIGYLPESAPSYADMTVHGFLSFIADLRGLSGSAKKAAVHGAVETCLLDGVLHQPIDTLSKGYRHRTCLAQAILHDPDVLILDEPTDGLDPNQKHAARELIRRMGQTKAIVFSTHILEEVEAACTRAVIIDRGSVVANGTPAELKARSATAGCVRVMLGGTPADAATAQLAQLPGALRVEAIADPAAAPGAPVILRVYPKRDDDGAIGSAGAALTVAVAQCAQSAGWQVQALSTEEGRLEDVFRSITLPDTVAR
jgi:ABC-2 type transport system ATP-binding protein